MRLFTFFSLIVLYLFTNSCTKNTGELSVSFYYWETNFNLNSYELNAIKEYDVKKLYIRNFDVDWDFEKNSAEIVAPVRGYKKLNGIETVPVVFINNEIFYKEKQSGIKNLADLVLSEIRRINNDSVIKEIQVDCDWTETTKDKYFEFINDISDLAKPVKISTTIRLHQVKFRGKTGVPRVSRGALMIYNVGRIGDLGEKNSICIPREVNNYVSNLKTYPVELNFALPIFTQGVLFRNGKAVYLIPNISRADFNDVDLFKPDKDNKFIVQKNAYFKSKYIYAGDIIRYEKAEYQDLKETVDIITKNSKFSDKREVIFFRLDSALLTGYTKDEIQNIINRLR